MSNINWRAAIRRPSFLAALAVLLIVGIIWTVTAVRATRPESLDQRTYDVASQIQCPICNGESVADSPSATAQELRDVIHEQLAEGKSEQQTIDYLHRQYGDTILESPPKQGFTTLIWLAPVLMFLAGLVMLSAVAREWRVGQISRLTTTEEDAEENDLSPQERARYLALLHRDLDIEEGMEGA